MDVHGELSGGTLTRYWWASTHVAHFHKEDGSPPDWVGDGLTASEQEQFEVIRQQAQASDTESSGSDNEMVSVDPGKRACAKHIRATSADVHVPPPAPSVTPCPYAEKKQRSQSGVTSGRQMLLFTLLVLYGGWQQHVAGWTGGISVSDQSSVFVTIIMAVFLGVQEGLWESWIRVSTHTHASCADCEEHVPSQRRSRSRCLKYYANTLQTDTVRFCMDCTEFRAESHTDLRHGIASFSKYKTGTTVKFLVAVSPTGTIVFVSYGYPWGVTDRQLTDASGLMKYLESGDVVLADRGFLIAQRLAGCEAHLLVAHTRFDKADRFAPDQLLKRKSLSNVRIHVERAMVALKSFGYFDRTLRTKQKNLPFPCFYVASMLANFGRPLLTTQDQDGVQLPVEVRVGDECEIDLSVE